jgi:hypothetical protein
VFDGAVAQVQDADVADDAALRFLGQVTKPDVGFRDSNMNDLRWRELDLAPAHENGKDGSRRTGTHTSCPKGRKRAPCRS